MWVKIFATIFFALFIVGLAHNEFGKNRALQPIFLWSTVISAVAVAISLIWSVP